MTPDIAEGTKLTNDYIKTVAVVLVALLAFTVAYSPGLNAPFYFDDYSALLTNHHIVQDNYLAYILDGWQRMVGNVTFVANLHYAEPSPVNFRAVNFLLHLLMSLFVFLFIRLVVHPQSTGQKWLVVGLAFLFLIHPINSQPVVYVVQRYTLLAALFVVASLYFYIVARQKCSIVYLLLSALFGALAIFSKQNAVVLPALVLLVEYFVVRRFTAGQIITFSLVMLLVASLALFLSGISWDYLDALTRETDKFTRLEYFGKQVSVVLYYIKLFFVPTDLHLHYDNSELALFSFSVWSVAVIHLGIILLVIVKGNSLVKLGVTFFYLSMLIESGFIPIKDLIFEHRTYLPNVGMIILLYGLLNKISVKYGKGLLCCAALSLLACVYATHNRTALWGDKYQFLANEFDINPKNNRVMNDYIVELNKRNLVQKSKAILDDYYKRKEVDVSPALILNTIYVYLETDLREAEYYLNIAKQNTHQFLPVQHGRYFFLLGKYFLKIEDHFRAFNFFMMAHQIYPSDIDTVRGLVLVTGSLNMQSEYEHYKQLLSQLEVSEQHI